MKITREITEWETTHTPTKRTVRVDVPVGWLEYPKNSPKDLDPSTDQIRWYWIITTDSYLTKACWWGHWYCFGDETRIVAFFPLPLKPTEI